MPFPQYDSENQKKCSDRDIQELGLLGLTLDRGGCGSCCLERRTSCIGDLERDQGIRVIGIRGIVCILIADGGDECVYCIAALQAARASELEEICTVIE